MLKKIKCIFGVLLCIVLSLLTKCGYAMSDYSGILQKQIEENGIFSFEKKSGITYFQIADYAHTEHDSMLLVFADLEKQKLQFTLWDEQENIAQIELSIRENVKNISIVVGEKNTWIEENISNRIHQYQILSNQFVESHLSEQKWQRIKIAEVENKTVKIYGNYQQDGALIQDRLNKMKLQKMMQYRMKKVKLEQTEEHEIYLHLIACADLMEYNQLDYEYDKLFCHLLYTHENFRILSNLTPDKKDNGKKIGEGGIWMVNSNYMDYIINHIFHLTPEHPPASQLTKRGYCYHNGYYYYTGAYNHYIETKIEKISGIYFIDKLVYYIVFQDVYREENKKKTEISYAILKKQDLGGYCLLRINMGGVLPEETELMQYAENPIQNQLAEYPKQAEKPQYRKIFLDAIFVIVILLFVVGILFLWLF